MLPYKTLLRPLLFSLPSEKAHRLGEMALQLRFLWNLLEPYYRTADPRLKTSLAGIELPNPVGVAAGCDKNCQFLPSLLSLGFGYVVGGTVTLEPRRGNPSPRLVRNTKQRSLVNSLGFPSIGTEAVRRNLEKIKVGPIIVSIAGLTVEEFIECFRRMEPRADGIELNISSPNTAGLKIFHELETLRMLLEQVNSERKKPLFLKIPPYGDEAGRQGVMELVRIAQQVGVDGITAANTKPIQEPRLMVGNGGLSGKPLFQDTLEMVAELRRELGEGIVINACGGISSPGEALQALKRGASTVQIYTGLIYEGPGVARGINHGLSRYLKEHNIACIQELGKSQRGDSATRGY